VVPKKNKHRLRVVSFEYSSNHNLNTIVLNIRNSLLDRMIHYRVFSAKLKVQSCGQAFEHKSLKSDSSNREGIRNESRKKKKTLIIIKIV
jgi:hypothetical protein